MRIRPWLTPLALLLGILIIALVQAALVVRGPRLIFYLSDTLFLPALYRDAISGGAAQWQWPNVPFFYPDLLLYFLIAAIVPNLHWSLAMFGITQVTLFALGIGLLTQGALPERREVFPVAFLAAALGMALSWFGGDGIVFSYLSVQHFGALVAWVYSLAALLYLLHPHPQRNTVIVWGLMILNSVLASFSDQIYMVQFVAPALIVLAVAWVFRWFERQRLQWLLVGTGLSSLAGYGLYRLIPGIDASFLQPASFQALSFITFRLLSLAQSMHSLLLQKPIFFAIYLGFALAMLFSFWRFVRRRGELADADDDHRLVLILLIVVGMVLISFAFTTLVLNWLPQPDVVLDIKATHRYQIPSLLLPLGAAWVWALLMALAPSLRDRFIQIAGWALTAAAILVSLVMLGDGIQAVRDIEYDPPELACIEQQIAVRGLHSGVSGYWQTLPISLLSNQPLELASISPAEQGIVPFVWITNREWYANEQQFLLVDNEGLLGLPMGLDQDTLLHFVEPPAERIHCGSITLLIFAAGQSPRFAFLASLENPYTVDSARAYREYVLATGSHDINPWAFQDAVLRFPGFIFPTNLAEIEGLNLTARPADGTGTLVDSPLYPVLAGERLSYKLYYQASQCVGGDPAHWRLEAPNAAGPDEVLASGVLPADQNAVSGSLLMEQAAMLYFNLYYDAHCPLSFDQLVLKVSH